MHSGSLTRATGPKRDFVFTASRSKFVDQSYKSLAVNLSTRAHFARTYHSKPFRFVGQATDLHLWLNSLTDEHLALIEEIRFGWRQEFQRDTAHALVSARSCVKIARRMAVREAALKLRVWVRNWDWVTLDELNRRNDVYVTSSEYAQDQLTILDRQEGTAFPFP